MNAEVSPNTERYSLTIIKPDAFRDHLSQQIIADLEESGLAVVYRKEMRLEAYEAEATYEEHRCSLYFPYMVGSLLLQNNQGEQYPCMLLVLKAEVGNALEINIKIKGKGDKTGIRAKYRFYSWHELGEKGYQGQVQSMMFSRNRLHVPDNHNRMIEILGLLLTENDMENFLEEDRKLADEIKLYCGLRSKVIV